MKKNILFGSLIAGFLILVSPMIAAIQGECREDGIDELNNNIIEHDSLILRYVNNIKSTIDSVLPCGDPDGPYKGRLDDPTDWAYFAGFCLCFMSVVGIILKAMDLDGADEPPDLLWQLCYGEAMDTKDYDGDGC